MNARLKLFVKKQIYVPTAAGWLLLFACTSTVLFLAIHTAYPFLAYDNRNSASVFIIEGWVPDHVLNETLPVFREGHSQRFITTGGPLKLGCELSRYETYAGLTAARLVKLGIEQGQIVAVPNDAVERDRTYAAALAVREWLLKNPGVSRANLVTKGPHARRSFVIFKSVLPSAFDLGVCAVPPRDYDPQRWWASSEGFRTVVSEAIAYAYARTAGPG